MTSFSRTGSASHILSRAFLGSQCFKAAWHRTHCHARTLATPLRRGSFAEAVLSAPFLDWQAGIGGIQEAADWFLGKTFSHPISVRRPIGRQINARRKIGLTSKPFQLTLHSKQQQTAIMHWSVASGPKTGDIKKRLAEHDCQ